jgi:predicted dehydrogenase
MASRLGIGVISFAHGHAGTYCQQMVSFEDVKLVAAWDDDPERGAAAAGRYGMRYTPHLEDLLADPGIRAVIVTSETSRHADHIVAAAEAGKAILCQKPMALTLADCDRILGAIGRTGVFFEMAFQMRHDPANRKMKELVDSGAVGRVGTIRRRHCINVLFSEGFVKGPTRWHLDPGKNMGMFMDDAVHATDWFRWMLGDPVSVTAEIDNVLTDVAPDDTGVAVYRFANREMGILYNSSVTLAAESTTEIYGDRGVLLQNYGDGPSTAMPRPADAVPLRLFQKDRAAEGWQAFALPIPKSQGDRIAAVPRPFVDHVRLGQPPEATAMDGRKSVEMILGAYQSARTGKRVSFPL